MANYNHDFVRDPERLHQFSCGHSVEHHGRLMPISSRTWNTSARSNTRQTYYNFECERCEWRKNVEEPTVTLMKTQILKLTKAALHNDIDVFEDIVEWERKTGQPSRVTVSFWCFQENQLVNTIASASARALDGNNAHKWKAAIREYDETANIRAVHNAEIDTTIFWKEHEEKWNEPIPGTQAPSKVALEKVDPFEEEDPFFWDEMLRDIDSMRKRSRLQNPGGRPPTPSPLG